MNRTLNTLCLIGAILRDTGGLIWFILATLVLFLWMPAVIGTWLAGVLS